MFIGNKKSVNFLSKTLKSGKISHAYIFSGPESTGKFTLARLFAAALISGSKQIDLGMETSEIKDGYGLPTDILMDLVIIKPEIEEKKGKIREKDISIEKVRIAQKNLSLFPSGGNFKVLVIDKSEKMTSSAQNALLKSLEEPNKNTVIIIVTSDEPRLLPTIKSRCQRILFMLVGENDIMPDGFEGIGKKDILFSMGRPGYLLGLSKSNKNYKKNEEFLDYFEKFPFQGINERFYLAEALSRDSRITIEMLQFWSWIMRDRILSNKADEFSNYKNIEKIQKSIEIISTTNANVRLLLENLFLEI